MCADTEMVQAVRELLQEDVIVPVLAIAFGCTTGMVAIVSGAFARVMIARGRERTKRELAAYVAEGTLDPEKAVALANAGTRQGGDTA